jgi:hypothetical protein
MMFAEVGHAKFFRDWLRQARFNPLAKFRRISLKSGPRRPSRALKPPAIKAAPYWASSRNYYRLKLFAKARSIKGPLAWHEAAP